MIVENVMPEYYAEMLDVWENSVRATHDFLTDDDIEYFKICEVGNFLLKPELAEKTERQLQVRYSSTDSLRQFIPRHPRAGEDLLKTNC